MCSFHLLRNRKDIISNKKVIPEEIERIKLKLFHLDSIVVLKVLASSMEIVLRLVVSNNLFNGIIPKIVTPKARTQ